MIFSKVRQLPHALREHVRLGLQLAALRRMVARRRRTPFTSLALGFFAPVLAVGAYAAFKLGNQMQDHVPPIQAVVAGLAMAVGWATRLHMKVLTGSNWSCFLRRMPLPPTAIVVLQTMSSMMHVMVSLFLLLFFSTGIAGTISAKSIMMRLASGIIAAIWITALAAAVSQILIRIQSLRRPLALATAVATALLITGLAMHHRISPAWTADAALAASGLYGLAEAIAGVSNSTGEMMTGWLRSIAVGIVMLTVAMLCSRYPLPRSASCPHLWGTRWLGYVGALIPGPLSAQVSVEWLRTFRSHAPTFKLLVISACLLAFWTRSTSAAGGESLPMAILLCFLLTAYAGNDLRSRSPRGPYWIAGVKARDYLLGAASAMGAAIGTACAVVYILGTPDTTSLHDVVWIFMASATVGAILLHPLAGIDYDLRSLFQTQNTPIQKIMASIVMTLPILMMGWMVFIGFESQPLITAAVAFAIAFAGLARLSFARIAAIYWS